MTALRTNVFRSSLTYNTIPPCTTVYSSADSGFSSPHPIPLQWSGSVGSHAKCSVTGISAVAFLSQITSKSHRANFLRLMHFFVPDAPSLFGLKRRRLLLVGDTDRHDSEQKSMPRILGGLVAEFIPLKNNPKCNQAITRCVRWKQKKVFIVYYPPFWLSSCKVPLLLRWNHAFKFGSKRIDSIYASSTHIYIYIYI